MSSEIKVLQERFPWLGSVPDRSEDYLDPSYYDKLLRDYAFSGRSDLELLDEHLRTVPDNARTLELGCGSGRATDQILTHKNGIDSLDLVDLSRDMVGHCRAKYRDIPQISVHQSDSVDFLGTSDNSYSSVVSLWNLSHSIHQHMFRLGRTSGSAHVENALEDFIVNRLEDEGSMYLIHYDIQSPEQRLINPWRLQLWEKADPAYDASAQSPSKELLDGFFSKMQEQGFITFNVDHLQGDSIEYPSQEIALETFLNFHMEGHFNQRPELPRVVKALLEGFEPYTTTGGSVEISPAAFVYDVSRTGKQLS